MPYRWATFLAMSSAYSSVLSLVSAFLAFAGGHLLGGLMFGVVAVLSICSCIGLLRRRRFGVVVFAVLCVVQVMSAPFVERTPSHPFMQTIKINPSSLSELAAEAMSLQVLASVVVTVISAIVMYIYFRNRWPLMADQTQ
jgi:hypothetical protein